MRKLLDDGGLKLHLQDVKDPRREEGLFLCFGALGKSFFTEGGSDQPWELKEQAFKEMIKWTVGNEQEQMAFTQEL